MRSATTLIIGALLAACGSPASSAPVAGLVSPSPSAPSTLTPSVPPAPTPDESMAEATEAVAGLTYIRQTNGVGQVFLIDEEDEPKQLTDLPPETSWGGATSAAWAPDGSILAFSIGVPVGVSVGLVAAEGGEVRTVDGAAFPAWSPNEPLLAVGAPFDVIGPGAENLISVSLVDLETGVAEQVTTGILPAWHPDGRLTVMRSIGASESAGGTPVAVAVDVKTGEEEELLRAGTDIAWSADGRRIAFVTDAPETCPPACHRIVVAWADALDDVIVVGPGTVPRWSPDGELLSMMSLDDGPTHVVLLDLATGDRMDLGEGDAASVAWSPTGDRLAFTVTRPDGSLIIRVVDRAGAVLAEVIGQSPAWRPRP